MNTDSNVEVYRLSMSNGILLVNDTANSSDINDNNDGSRLKCTEIKCMIE